MCDILGPGATLQPCYLATHQPCYLATHQPCSLVTLELHKTPPREGRMVKWMVKW